MNTPRPVRPFTSAACAPASLVLALACAACGAQFDPGSTVSGVRILAVQGAPAFAAPGESVSLNALAVDPAGRTLSFAWTTCVNPLSSAVNACFAKIIADAQAGHPPQITTGDGLTAYALQVPSDALAALPPGAAANAMVGVVTVACPGTISLADSAPSDPDELPVRCADASGAALPPEDFVVSVKRIAVRAHDRNANPAIAAITWNGTPWPDDEVHELAACDNDAAQYLDCTGGERPVIAARPAPDAVEVGVDELGTPFHEQVIAQYYVTQGAFEFEVRLPDAPETHWVARHSAIGTDQTMWFVLRDDRGGVSWASRRVHVR